MSTIQRNAVTVTGQAHGRPLVFSHGYGCDQSTWRFVAPVIMGNTGRPELVAELANSFCATDPEIARKFAYVHEHLAGSTLVAMNATGHCPNLSAPAETIDAIRAFL